MRKTFAALAITLLLGINLLSAPTVSAEGPAYHVVKPGEGLWSLSIRYGVTLEALLRANGLANPNWIHAGQVLVIPRAPRGPEYHTVRAGETVYSISRQYGVSTWAIVYKNGIQSNLIHG